MPAACSSSCSATIGWRRDEVFITNIVKCRPPGNRDPEPDEIAACAPVPPSASSRPSIRRVVVTLGRYSMGTVHARCADLRRPTGPPCTRIRRRAPRDATVYAMYHPAAALRTPAIERETLRGHGGASRRSSIERARTGGAATRPGRPGSPSPTAAADPSSHGRHRIPADVRPPRTPA
ncbi:MAG: uracil-DNA glycosylase family protein [Candidatus Limnocylindrales bacterium]